MEGPAEVKRRIENAESELRVAKNELTRLQANNKPVERAIEYLDSIGCSHTVNYISGSKGVDIKIHEGYTWNVKSLYEACETNPAVQNNIIKFRE